MTTQKHFHWKCSTSSVLFFPLFLQRYRTPPRFNDQENRFRRRDDQRWRGPPSHYGERNRRHSLSPSYDRNRDRRQRSRSPGRRVRRGRQSPTSRWERGRSVSPMERERGKERRGHSHGERSPSPKRIRKERERANGGSSEKGTRQSRVEMEDGRRRKPSRSPSNEGRPSEAVQRVKRAYQGSGSDSSSSRTPSPPVRHEIPDSELSVRWHRGAKGLDRGEPSSAGAGSARDTLKVSQEGGDETSRSRSPGKERKRTQEVDQLKRRSHSPVQPRAADPPKARHSRRSRSRSSEGETSRSRRRRQRSGSGERRDRERKRPSRSPGRRERSSRRDDRRHRKRSPIESTVLPSKWARHRDSADSSSDEDRELEKAYHGEKRGSRSRSASDIGEDMFGLAKLSKECFS